MTNIPSNLSCAFCQIVQKQVPAAIVFEDTLTLAFLDRRPLFPGHALLVPKAHLETLPDLPDELVAPLFIGARLLTQAVQEAMEAEGSFVAINNKVSQSVPHLHVHIVPRRRKDGLKGFFWPRNPYPSPQEMERVRQAIAAAAQRLSAR